MEGNHRHKIFSTTIDKDGNINMEQWTAVSEYREGWSGGSMLLSLNAKPFIHIGTTIKWIKWKDMDNGGHDIETEVLRPKHHS